MKGTICSSLGIQGREGQGKRIMLRLTKSSARLITGFPDTSRTAGQVLDDLDGDANHFRDRRTSGELAKLY
jgi:hypothetical protein